MIKIRRADKADAVKMAELEKLVFSMPWSERSFREALERESGLYIAAFDDEVLAGYCGLRAIAGEGDITHVAVREEYRRQGVGRKLLEQLISLGRAKGLAAFTLEVRESNKAAIALYTEAGFKSAGVRKNFYDRPCENGVIMWYNQEQDSL